MSEWREEAAYGRDAKNKTPSVVSLNLQHITLNLDHKLKLAVHRLMGIEDQWFYSIKWGGMTLLSDSELEEKDLESAKKEATRKASDFLYSLSVKMAMISSVLAGGRE